MSDWIKLPSGRFLNLDRFAGVSRLEYGVSCFVADEGDLVPIDSFDADTLLAALEARCTKLDR